MIKKNTVYRLLLAHIALRESHISWWNFILIMLQDKNKHINLTHSHTHTHI